MFLHVYVYVVYLAKRTQQITFDFFYAKFYDWNFCILNNL